MTPLDRTSGADARPGTVPRDPGPPTAAWPDRRPRTGWRLAAAALLMGSALLQLHAATERWIVAATTRVFDDAGIQDGRFDHAFPSREWEPLGDAAETHGVGLLLLALAVVAVARATGITGAAGLAGTAVIAATSAAVGAHALLSGITGTPSPLAGTYLPMLALSTTGCVAVAVAVVRGRAPRGTAWDALGAVLVVGALPVGQLVALFAIAPVIWGGTYSDTPIHTESVVATSTACAGVAMLVSALLARHRRDRGSLVPRDVPAEEAA
ncbi:hypothetical protein [Clavibacter sp. km1a]|uniref:hypothetical protein n=1 Tax=Clavibacter sp. km1a TaxID=3459136 RepID=UPI0040435B86